MIKMDIRIEESSVEQLQQLVDEGEFTNISEAIRWCIRMQLKSKGRSPPPLGMKFPMTIEEGGVVCMEAFLDARSQYSYMTI